MNEDNRMMSESQEEGISKNRLECPSDVGPQLVDILYANTNLNYDACATSLVEVFAHLSKRVPTLESVSQTLIKSIEASVSSNRLNPDLITLDRNIKQLHSLNADLQSGEKNFYECTSQISQALNESTLLLLRQSNDDVFKKILSQNHEFLMSLVDMWQLAVDVEIKNKLVRFLYVSFLSDPILVCLLFENTNIAIELCCSIQSLISQTDRTSLLNYLNCLVTIVSNSRIMPPKFLDYLKESDFYKCILETIESDADLLFTKLSDCDDKCENMNVSRRQLKQQRRHHRRDSSRELALIDVFIHLLLAINKKFLMPDENSLIIYLVSDQQLQRDHKNLSETLLNLFNFEYDPLLDYELKVDLSSEISSIAFEATELYYVNSTLKILSDLFTYDKTVLTTSIFYSSDFNVLIDIVIRKLCNLSASDQIRVDYLSLIQLIIRNSNYLQSMYRRDDLLQCFRAILDEKDADTIDQDIVRIILSENPQFQAN